MRPDCVKHFTCCSQTSECSPISGHRLRRTMFMIGLFCAGGLTVALAQAGMIKLYLNGKLASTRVRMLDGTAYVPVSDVARGLGQNMVTLPDGFGITRPGGANEVAGLTGRIGDVVFDGSWRFTVDKVTETQEYVERYTPEGAQTWHAAPGEKLILVDVTLKNGMNRENFLQMYSADEKLLTALAATDGSSIRFKSFDMRTGSGKHYGGGGDWDNTRKMLPGSEQKFTIIFNTPDDFKARDLIFTLAYPKEAFGKLTYSHLRISLKRKEE